MIQPKIIAISHLSVEYMAKINTASVDSHAKTMLKNFSFNMKDSVVGGLAVSMSDCEVIVQGSIPGQPMFP